MNIEVIIQNNNERPFDISQLVSNIEWSTDIENGQPGSLKFDYKEDTNIIPHYGAWIRFRVGNRGVFFGRLFKKDRSESDVMQITAYDNTRRLKNKHTYAFPALTSSRMFTRICNDFNIPHKVVDASDFNTLAKVYDNETLHAMLQDSFNQTLIARRRWFFVRDNFGTLEHINIDSLQTSLVIGDQSMATNFDFKGSIDEDTYNQVRLVRENEETMRREVYIVRDSNNIRNWWLLQYHDTVDDNLNAAQIEARATMILNAKNRPTRSLKITALGDLRIRAGNGIVLSIAKLESEGFSKIQRALVSVCKHNWSGGVHTMDLTLRVVN